MYCHIFLLGQPLWLSISSTVASSFIMGREMSEPFTVNSTLTQTATLVENKKTNLMSLAVTCCFNFLCAQRVSDINISIIRSLRHFCWITTLVMCSWFDVCWCFGVPGLEWYPCCRLKLKFSAITMMHGPINIRDSNVLEGFGVTLSSRINRFWHSEGV